MEDQRLYLFAQIFILENRLLTACEKIQKEITIKQWLLLAITMKSKEQLNYTQLGEITGCSRQNVKKLANQLQEKGFIKIINGKNRSQHLQVLDKINQYEQEMNEKHNRTIELLFSEFDIDEISTFSKMLKKLKQGIEKIEEYVNEIN